LCALTLLLCSASAQPRWVGPPPNASLPAAGLVRLPGTRRVTVFNSSLPDGGMNPAGLYNHGPMLWRDGASGTFLCMWYNAPERESAGMRVLLATSADLASWSAPQELFPAVDAKGEENEPFALLNGSLYASATDIAWGNAHDSGERGALLMRRLLPTRGPIFWAADALPPPSVANASFRFPLYTDLDAGTRSDVSGFLARQINQTVAAPAAQEGRAVSFNERSMYRLPARPQQLVLLLRSKGKKPARLWASACELPRAAPRRPAPEQLVSYSCKSGTGGYEYETPDDDQVGSSSAAAVAAAAVGAAPGPRQCRWSVPIETNLPDAPSRTCAGRLPDGSIGVIGNQGGGSRDPLTFIVAADGEAFSRQWAVESGAPPPKWHGYRGFQYPSFLWCRECGAVRNEIVFAYSVSKEDIVITIAPLASLLDL
jgi:hypothetical protein